MEMAMELYKSCLKASQYNAPVNEDNTELATYISEDLYVPQSTIPAILDKTTIRIDENLSVYYISDLHLAHHLLNAFPAGASDGKIVEYIHRVVCKLFEGEIAQEIRRFNSPVVLFGGDVSSSFQIAELFYKSFKDTWRMMETEAFDLICNKCAPLEEEIAQHKKQIEEWSKKHPWTKRAVKPLTEYSSVPQTIKDVYSRCVELEKQLEDIEDEYGYGWKERYYSNRGSRFVYSVLGNHEFWDFTSYEDCLEKYATLFSDLGITLLNSSIAWLGKSRIPIKTHFNQESGKWFSEPLKREDNPKSYDIQHLYSGNIVIVGGVGYAALNPEFNAHQMIYGPAIDEEKERTLFSEWIEAFKEGKKVAEENHSSLVVLTHMPCSDWLERSDGLTNIVFFNGHTHRNTAIHEHGNVHCYADNQVGYIRKSFVLKRVGIYKPRNPFSADADGYRVITITEYREFYRYIDENVPGTGSIERHLREYGGSLLMVKRDGYYGFFISSPKGIYICNGGQLNRIDNPGSFDAFNTLFIFMVQTYLKALSPYRMIQEKAAAGVKSFGGTGRIHGCIVDVDFENHIMMDPLNGTISFYNSPMFGKVKTYSTIHELLVNHCPQLIDGYEEKTAEDLIPANGWMITPSNEYLENVNIKNSQYAISRKISPLQRLFDKHILRAWNTGALYNSLLKQKMISEKDKTVRKKT